MPQVKIINSTLQKPWLLIALYESMFDTYLLLIARLQKMKRGTNGGRVLTWVTEERIAMLKDSIKRTQECFREADAKIHSYIISHQS